MVDPHGGKSPAPAGAQASPVRLVVLLAILAIAVAALAYDFLVAGPGALAADKVLTAEAHKHISAGLDTASSEEKQQKRDDRFDPADVQKILNKSPTKVKKGDNYVIEYYCWWGYVPLNRHYVSVIYHGKEPNLRYSAHLVNSSPAADDLPGYQPPSSGDSSAPAGYTAPTGGGMGGAAGPPPVDGDSPPMEGKGKGKKGQRPAEETESAATPTGEPPPPSEATDKAQDAPPEAADKEPAKEKAAEEKPAADEPETNSDKSSDAEKKQE